MIPLLLTSIVSLAFILERALALRRQHVIPHAVVEAIETWNSDRLTELRQLCEQYPSSLSRLVLTAVDHLNWPKSDNVMLLQTRARHEISRLERGLVVLEMIVGVAPLLGLMGTIHGLMVLFHDLAAAGAGNAVVLARGISIALNTTLTGLAIAIPSLVAWSYFSKKVENLAIEMENLLDEFLRRIYRQQTTRSRRSRSVKTRGGERVRSE